MGHLFEFAPPPAEKTSLKQKGFRRAGARAGKGFAPQSSRSHGCVNGAGLEMPGPSQWWENARDAESFRCALVTAALTCGSKALIPRASQAWGG